MTPLIRWGLTGLGLVVLVWVGHEVIGHITSWLDMSLMPDSEDMRHKVIILGTIAYVVLLALPFVPGAEIGLTLLTVLGGTVAPLIYLATAASLSLAYMAGRLFPASVLENGLKTIGLRRAAALVGELADMTEAEIQETLLNRSGSRMKTFALRHRYVGLALTFNMPGNAVIGGGGGIALIAGLSRMFSPLPFFLTVLVAVLPVPLLFYIGTF